MNNEPDIAILRALLKKEKMNFQEIVYETVPNRNSARQKLDRLIKLRFVVETSGGHGKGYRHWFKLTRKGRAACIRLTVNELNETLRIIQEMAATILSKPSLIDEFREERRQAFFGIKITESMPIEERIRIASTEERRTYGPMQDAYKSLHRLLVQIDAPKAVRDLEFFIGYSKRGVLHFIPRAFLEKQHLAD